MAAVDIAQLVRLFGVLMALGSGLLLFGWYSLNWAIDPFLMTLLLVAAPFFFAMGSDFELD